jgi:16S rRNA (guanine966-N2)-methyltransferase
MRVIAGRFRSRKLKSVPGLAVRPTPDRLRESLFSILASRIEGAVFVDAYAGSGAVGIEALSRGAKHVFLIERNDQALSIVRENLDSLQIAGEVAVLRGSASALLAEQRADIVFLDPPYDKVNEYRAALLALSQVGCPYVIAQHTSRLTLDDAYGKLSKTRVLKQGDNSLSFFEPSSMG